MFFLALRTYFRVISHNEEKLTLEGQRNCVLDLSTCPESTTTLHALVDSTKDKGDGRIKCTVTKHRLAKAAIVLGVQILKKKPPKALKKVIERWAPQRVRGRTYSQYTLVLECSSPQGLLEEVDALWKLTLGVVSHRRIMTAALSIGLSSLNKVDPIKMRLLVSKVCPVAKKYWDSEIEQWL